jgi:hypothetical protein
MIICLHRERIDNDDYQKLIMLIREVLESNFVIVVPGNHQQVVINFQLVARSIFEIDPALKRIESLKGVVGADMYIPYCARIHQERILREIDNKLNTKEAPPPAPEVLTFGAPTSAKL